jgi:multidrug efflux pump subunit AcrA (membrane-fusion protein)
MRGQWRWALLALAAAAGCAARGEGGSESGAGAVKVPKAVKVTVAPIERRPVERTVEVVGTLKGWEHVTVGAKKGGRVLKVLRDMGDRVRPGDKLVEIDTIDAKLAVAQAETKYLAELAKLGIDPDRAREAYEELGASGIIEALLKDPKELKPAAQEARKQWEREIDATPPIKQAIAAADKAHQNYMRQKRLYDLGAGKAEDLSNAKTDYDSGKAALDNAKATARNVIATAVTYKVAYDVSDQALKDLTVAAPQPTTLPQDYRRPDLSFGVSKRSVAEGQILRDGDAVCELVIENPLRLWTNVPERYVGDVKIGQEVRVRVSAYPKRVFKGTVTRVNPSVDQTSRTFQVESAIPNEERLLRPGSFAKAAIITDLQSQAITVPIESVVHFAGVTKIFLAENGQARSVEVTTGLEGVPTDAGADAPSWIEVIGPIAEGSLVVTTGMSQLANGTPLEVRQPEPEKSPDAEKEKGTEVSHRTSKSQTKK